MRDDIFLLDQIQPFGDDRVVLVLVFPHLEQDLDHVLHPLIDPALVQNRAEPIKDSIVGSSRVFRQERTDFAHEGDGDLDGIVGRSFEEEDEHLEGENFMGYLLIH